MRKPTEDEVRARLGKLEEENEEMGDSYISGLIAALSWVLGDSELLSGEE